MKGERIVFLKKRTDGQTDGGCCNISHPGPSARWEIKMTIIQLIYKLSREIFLCCIAIRNYTIRNRWCIKQKHAFAQIIFCGLSNDL